MSWSVALSLTSGPSLSGCSGPGDWPPTRYEDWELQDPAGQSVGVVRRIRDDIDARVQQLLSELVPADA